MVKKPTYEELVQKIKELEKEAFERKKAEEALQKAHDELERRLKERTAELKMANEQLQRESEERKRADESLTLQSNIVENMAEGVYLIRTIDGMIVYANETFERMFGYDSGELVNKHVSNVNAPSEKSPEEISNDIIHSLKENGIWSGEIHNIKKDGTTFWCHANVSTFYHHSFGEVWISVHQDISERKRVEEQISRQNRVLDGINRVFREALTCESDKEVAYTCLSVAEELTGSKFGLIGEVNPAGRFDTIAISNPGWDVCKMPDSEATRLIKDMEIRGIDRSTIREEKSRIVNDPASHPDRVGTPDGHPPVTSFLGVPLKSSDKTIGMIGLGNKEPGYDLADQQAIEDLSIAFVEALMRKRAEEALQKSEAHKKAILDASIDVIRLVDKEMRIIWANRTTTTELKTAPEQLVGSCCYEAVAGRDTPCPGCPTKKALKSGKTEHVLMHQKELKGIKEETYWEDYAVPIKNESGDIVNVIQISRNITEQKTLEAQLRQSQKMEAVGTLAGGIAHDFNNLLQSISGFTDVLLGDKDPSDPDYKNLKIIEQSSQKAADLIGQLLIFSRKVESELKPVVLNRQIIEASKLLERTIPKMISIEHNLAQDLKIVNADPVQIGQVLINLGINARDAMPDGGRLIFETENITLNEQYCKTHPEAGPGEYVLLSITDTGHGMDKETLEHVFDPFYSTKEIGKGTGLGLAMVYGIVKSHGGYIMCYSEPGLGTTFKIYFPVLITGSPAEERAEPETETLPGGRETVLLVDDDAQILKLGKIMLELHGYTTIMAESGERAIEIYGKEKEHIDLVILDMGMPGIGGYKCLDHLLKIDPGIKVIIATGYGLNGKVKETLESGTAGYMGKPFLKADMLKKVREVLDNE